MDTLESLSLCVYCVHSRAFEFKTDEKRPELQKSRTHMALFDKFTDLEDGNLRREGLENIAKEVGCIIDEFEELVLDVCGQQVH